jgi:redox-sensitive bicupin YhaK (pirin superfamily)
VLNGDVVESGAGFDTHLHNNMEIVSMPLAGTLRQPDSTGHEHVIHAGEVQIMSAGTGITHPEYNDSLM